MSIVSQHNTDNYKVLILFCKTKTIYSEENKFGTFIHSYKPIKKFPFSFVGGEERMLGSMFQLTPDGLNTVVFLAPVINISFVFARVQIQYHHLAARPHFKF